jgi:hypothetical protein
MSDLLDFVIDRRGGTDRWHQTPAVSATVHVDGGFWAFKGQSGRLGHGSVPADLDHWRNSLETWYAEQGRQHE